MTAFFELIFGTFLFGIISTFVQTSMGGGGEIITPLDQLSTLLSSL